MFIRGGQILLSLSLEELEAGPGRDEAVGNIEMRRPGGVSWFLVREHEGFRRAAHRALDLYMTEGGRASIDVLRKAGPDLYIAGVEWELVIAFRPVHEEGPRSVDLGPLCQN